LNQSIDAKLKRRSLIFVGILVAGLAGYKLLTRAPEPIHTAAESCFEAGRGRQPSAADSTIFALFHAKLDAAFQALSRSIIAENGLDKIPAAQIRADFEPRLITWELLRYLCKQPSWPEMDGRSKNGAAADDFPFGLLPDFQDLNAYLGSGDFGKALAHAQFHPGVACEMENALQDRYLMVLKTESRVEPGYISGSQVYATGRYSGTLFIVDLEQGIVVAQKEVFAGNDPAYDDPLHYKSARLGVPLDNLLDSIFSVASQHAVAIFGKPILQRPRR
jgi:hypothetical protein